MAATNEQGIQTAGDVKLEVSISTVLGGVETDIRQFIGEVNIFEDLFKNGLYGNILIVDAANIASILPIVGDEYLAVKIETPGTGVSITRTFKVYSLTDRRMIKDTNTQTFVLHFCSPELFIDLLSPVYGTYRGKVTDLVQQIWDEAVSTGNTPLNIIGEASNEITFTSPGWSPMHCINWLATHAIDANGGAPNFLLYESNKDYYFANMDQKIKSDPTFTDYKYMANNLTADPAGEAYVKDINAEYQKVEDFEIIETFNAFKNNQNGYYANRLITFDIQSKTFEIFDYDHVASYSQYNHLEKGAPFRDDTLRATAGHISFYPKHTELYTGVKLNANDVVEKVLPQRRSTIQELSNFKIVITVPGRTDIEVGTIINFVYPDNRPRDETDKSKDGGDEYYSGRYLVTAIRHKVTLIKHMMIMEIVKDSFRKDA